MIEFMVCRLRRGAFEIRTGRDARDRNPIAHAPSRFRGRRATHQAQTRRPTQDSAGL